MLISHKCFTQIVHFKVDGTITGEYYGKIYMFFEDDYKRKDSISADIINGKFTIAAAAKLPILARFHMGQQVSYIGDIYIDNSETEFTCTDSIEMTNNSRDTLNKFKIKTVSGSKLQKLISDFYTSIGEENNKTEAAGNVKYYQQLYVFVNTHKELIVSPYLISQSPDLNYSQLEFLGKLVSQNLTQTYEYKKMQSYIKRVKIHSQMLDSGFHNVMLKDTGLKTISTSSFLNKYTLFVFWASWCVPCRNENPYLTSLYDHYKEKGLTIVGISLENDITKWKTAIKKDELKWPQTIDTHAFDGELSTFYAINAIPYNILIDSTGTIIGKNLTVGNLNTTVTKLFE